MKGPGGGGDGDQVEAVVGSREGRTVPGQERGAGWDRRQAEEEQGVCGAGSSHGVAVEGEPRSFSCAESQTNPSPSGILWSRKGGCATDLGAVSLQVVTNSWRWERQAWERRSGKRRELDRALGHSKGTARRQESS